MCKVFFETYVLLLKVNCIVSGRCFGLLLFVTQWKLINEVRSRGIRYDPLAYLWGWQGGQSPPLTGSRGKKKKEGKRGKKRKKKERKGKKKKKGKGKKKRKEREKRKRKEKNEDEEKRKKKGKEKERKKMGKFKKKDHGRTHRGKGGS